MAVIKAVSSKAGISQSIDYVTKNEKTEEKLISGYNCQPETVAVEMQLTKEAWGKTDGRTYKHYVQSFHRDEPITPEKAHEIAKEFTEKCEQFQGFEVLIATHKDKEHIHTHFIVNSVSFEDGHKFQQSRLALSQMKDLSDEIVKRHGLKVVQKGKTYEGAEREETSTYTKESYRQQKKAEAGEVKSYVRDIALAVMEEKERATSKEEFIANLQSQGIGVVWQDSRKYITFIDLERQEQGEKQCKIRDNKLTQYYNIDFSKESLLNEFERNIRKSAEREEQLDGAIEQIRRIDSRTEPIDKPVRTRVEVGEIEGETTDGIFKKSEETSGRGSRIGAGASELLQTNQRMGGDEQTMESAGRTVEQAGRTVEQAGKNFIAMQRRIGEQQDMLERELAEQQQFYGTIIRGIEEIARDFKEIEGKQRELGKGQSDIKGKQRELGRKQSNIIDRIGEIGDRVRDFADKLKNNIQQVFKRGRGGR